MNARIPVVDVFAGPGGLNEGFSSLRSASGERVFETASSFEMDAAACRTLRLRAAVRRAREDSTSGAEQYMRFLSGKLPYDDLLLSPEFAAAYDASEKEVQQFELSTGTRSESDELINSALGAAASGDEPWILIGGPPCQAYSMAGRSRRKHDDTFKDDHKHTLYREYLHIIRRFRPAVFVMENVKGMLSSTHGGGKIFEAIREDLSTPGPGLRYEVRSFTVDDSGDALHPRDFVIRSELFGIPQTRHRVILLGVRQDVDAAIRGKLHERPEMTVRHAIGDLPKLRAGVTPRSVNSLRDWEGARLVAAELANVRAGRRVPPMGGPFDPRYRPGDPTNRLERWLRANKPQTVVQHESRFHMVGDLQRYGYLAFEALAGRAPRINDLPKQLETRHKNAGRVDTPFTDRFRVQQWAKPSSTIACHIAKDGHYYIHPDPKQMRSLTVREAARLQTFPDDYYFMGNRTQQYHQVGNAVPPLLARNLGVVVAGILGIDVVDELL